MADLIWRNCRRVCLGRRRVRGGRRFHGRSALSARPYDNCGTFLLSRCRAGATRPAVRSTPPPPCSRHQQQAGCAALHPPFIFVRASRSYCQSAAKMIKPYRTRRRPRAPARARPVFREPRPPGRGAPGRTGRQLARPPPACLGQSARHGLP